MGVLHHCFIRKRIAISQWKQSRKHFFSLRQEWLINLMKSASPSKVAERWGRTCLASSITKSQTSQNGGHPSWNLVSQWTLKSHRNFGEWSCSPLPWKSIQGDRKEVQWPDEVGFHWEPWSSNIKKETQLCLTVDLLENVFEDSPVSARFQSLEIRVQSRYKRPELRGTSEFVLLKQWQEGPWGERKGALVGLSAAMLKSQELVNSTMNWVINSCGIIFLSWMVHLQNHWKVQEGSEREPGGATDADHALSLDQRVCDHLTLQLMRNRRLGLVGDPREWPGSIAIDPGHLKQREEELRRYTGLAKMLALQGVSPLN